MAPSTDLQLVEGRQVHECAAGDVGDGIAVQASVDENRSAERKKICIYAVARDCQGEQGVMIASDNSGMGGPCGEGLLAVRTTTPTPLTNYRGRGSALR